MILIVGATGLLGGHITRLLLDSGKDVRILVRENPLSEELAKQGRATPAQSLIQLGAHPIYGDLKDRASLDFACKGVATVITTANAVLRAGEDTLESVDLRGTMSLIDAAKAAGVKHFIYTSLYGADVNLPVPLFKIKATVEKYLESSGLEYTILQPSVFMEIWIGMVVGIPLMARQPVTLAGKGDHKQNFISQGDVAAFAAACVDNPIAKNRSLPVGGPASYTWTEIVQSIGQSMGADLPIQYVPLGSPIPLLPPGIDMMLSGMEMGEIYIDMSQIAPEFGIDLTPLSSYIQNTFAVAPA